MINEGYESSLDGETEDNENENEKNVFTQTDVTPCTVRSWQIQRVSKRVFPTSTYSEESNEYISLFPDGTEVFVLEKHNVGFNASTQTFDDDIYRRTRHEIRDIVTSWRVLTILVPSLLYLIIFSLNQLLDIMVCSEFCTEDEWWCGIGIFFLIVPSFVLSIYAYDQLSEPDLATIKPVTKKVGRFLCCLQLTPHYLIGRRVFWSIKAWCWSDYRDERFRTQSRELWDKAALENDSTSIKMFQSLLESVPQLSLQSYVLLTKMSSQRVSEEEVPSTVLWMSVFVNLISASIGLALSQSGNMFEQIAGSVAIFTTLGSRAFICGGIGTILPGLWVAPIAASFLIGVVTKISETVDHTLSGILHRLPKYAFEGFMMASAFPPFDPSGFFCSAVYFLAALIFLVEDPRMPINITCVILATMGQSIWVCVGFCLLKRPSDSDRTTQTTGQPA